MSYLDSNGVLMYEDTDPISPLQVLLNTGQASISTVLGDVLPVTEDTGWVNVNFIGGFSGPYFQVRRIGPDCQVRFYISSSLPVGANDIGTVPAQFRPTEDAHGVLYHASNFPLSGTYIRADGMVVAVNTTDASRTISRATIRYMVG